MLDGSFDEIEAVTSVDPLHRQTPSLPGRHLAVAAICTPHRNCTRPTPLAGDGLVTHHSTRDVLAAAREEECVVSDRPLVTTPSAAGPLAGRDEWRNYCGNVGSRKVRPLSR